MNRYLLLYNPLAGYGTHESEIEALAAKYENPEKYDVTKLESYDELLSGLDSTDTILLMGGDGTINRFVNDTRHLHIPAKLSYFPLGTGNDFLRDVPEFDGEHPIDLDNYVHDLPVVEVKGKEYLFLNGVGYGVDGYCCEVGDKLKAQSNKPVNYTSIAIKGLLFHYKPTNAKVTVDGKEHFYKKVWIAPTMNGRFYGGGMMPTPDQDRLNDAHQLSLMVFHGSGKLRTLMIFPGIFKGEHIKHTKQVDVLVGKDIKVEFDHPVALQIDGETVLNVSGYHARSADLIKAEC